MYIKGELKMEYSNGLAFSSEIMKEVQDKFLYLNEDKFVGERLFFDIIQPYEYMPYARLPCLRLF